MKTKPTRLSKLYERANELQKELRLGDNMPPNVRAELTQRLKHVRRLIRTHTRNA